MPAAIELLGMMLVTSYFVPIILLLPIFTPFRIIESSASTGLTPFLISYNRGTKKANDGSTFNFP